MRLLPWQVMPSPQAPAAQAISHCWPPAPRGALNKRSASAKCPRQRPAAGSFASSRRPVNTAPWTANPPAGRGGAAPRRSRPPPLSGNGVMDRVRAPKRKDMGDALAFCAARCLISRVPWPERIVAGDDLPSVRTIARILERAGEVVPRRSIASKPPRRGSPDRRRREARRSVDGRFQGLVERQRWRPLRALDGTRRREPLRAVCPAHERHLRRSRASCAKCLSGSGANANSLYIGR